VGELGSNELVGWLLIVIVAHQSLYLPLILYYISYYIFYVPYYLLFKKNIKTYPHIEIFGKKMAHLHIRNSVSCIRDT
jgi:hypothetical protein